jgi:hypothetical protein
MPRRWSSQQHNAGNDKNNSFNQRNKRHYTKSLTILILVGLQGSYFLLGRLGLKIKKRRGGGVAAGLVHKG